MATAPPPSTLLRSTSELLRYPQPPASNKPNAVKYSDVFCKMYSDHIEILRYFYPTESSKYVNYDEIEEIHTTTSLKIDGHGMSMKTWGMSLFSHIWWARDDTRDPHYSGEGLKYSSIVLKIKDAWIWVAFSVEEEKTAIETLKKFIPHKRFKC